MNEEIKIDNDDYWYKVVGFLQENWALIEKKNDKYVVYFLMSDYRKLTKVFDQIAFETSEEAQKSLLFNGFRLYSKDDEFQKIAGPPVKPFIVGEHPNGKIYSSGRFWK